MGIKTPNLDKVDAWSGGGGILAANPDGTPRKHLVRIDAAKDNVPTSKGNPQLILEMSSDEGMITDWVVVIESTFGKVVRVYQATGVPIPQGDDAEVSAEPFVGRKVLITVGKVPDLKGEMRDRVIDYEPATSDVPVQNPQPVGAGDDKTLPF